MISSITTLLFGKPGDFGTLSVGSRGVGSAACQSTPCDLIIKPYDLKKRFCSDISSRNVFGTNRSAARIPLDLRSFHGDSLSEWRARKSDVSVCDGPHGRSSPTHARQI